MEIVIENPVEPASPRKELVAEAASPIQPATTITTTPTATTATTTTTTNTTPTSSSSATSVMTITIGENPTVPTYPPPVQFSYRQTRDHNSTVMYTGDYYGGQRHRNQGRMRSYEEPERVASPPSVRRVDKSGLLGIPGPETTTARGRSPPRHLAGVSAAGTVMASSPRRLASFGPLDPVLELPDRSVRANLPRENSKSNFAPSNPAVSRQERYTDETTKKKTTIEHYRSVAACVERPTASNSFDASADSWHGKLSQNKFDAESRASSVEPDVNRDFSSVRSPTATFRLFDCPSATTLPVLGERENETAKETRESLYRSEEEAEYAESPVQRAEDYEYGTVESSTDVAGLSSKRQEKLSDNDSIQTLRVIILSEQL